MYRQWKKLRPLSGKYRNLFQVYIHQPLSLHFKTGEGWPLRSPHQRKATVSSLSAACFAQTTHRGCEINLKKCYFYKYSIQPASSMYASFFLLQLNGLTFTKQELEILFTLYHDCMAFPSCMALPSRRHQNISSSEAESAVFLCALHFNQSQLLEH